MKDELKKVGISIVIIIVVAILLLQFYVSEITINQAIREGNYFVSDDRFALYWKVYENETADIYLFSFENGDVKSGVKMNMKCYYDWLNPFLEIITLKAIPYFR